MKKYFTACFLLLSVSSFAKIIFVKANASGANDSTSWANAYTKLQDALTTAVSGNQIWVAAGTYYPDKGAGLTDNDVNLSFNLKSGVAIYGGLVGTETQLSERNWQTNVSILSGDIDGVAGNGGNSFHVVRSISVDRTAVLDGFTISGGNAVGANRGDDEGGGILSELSSPAIANCSFSGNSAANGGVIYNYFSSSDLVNCSFSGNSASQHGGALNNGNGAGGVRLVNCSFSGNSAANGGAIYSVETNLTLSNCILWGNSSEIFSDRVLPATLTNSIVQGGFAGDGNLDQDPLFVNVANGNLRLQACSPAIDAGDNSAVKVATDLDDNTRIAHTSVSITK